MKKILLKFTSALCAGIMAVNVFMFCGASAKADTNQIEAFVERSYELILGRKSDPAGLNSWTQALQTGQLDAAHMVKGFIDSDEYNLQGNSYEDTIGILYRVMLDRKADSEGMKNWLDCLNYGVSYDFLINGFAGSIEFNNICSSYGIVPGSISYVQNRDKNYKVTRFVASCYYNILGRAPDAVGLNSWTGLINEHEVYPEDLILSFLNSSECAPRIYTDENYVDTLYRGILQRSPDASRDTWISIAKTQGRQTVFNGFISSSEFLAIIEACGMTLRPAPVPAKLGPTTKMVALTFDDGPYSPVTNRILNALEAVDGHATFFVVGNRVPTYKSCVTRAESLGCEIGNHTYDHKSVLTSQSVTSIRAEISGCNTEIYKVTGHYPAVMRPVGGAYNATVLANIGLPAINWSLDTQDWRNRNATSVKNAVLNNVRDGDIILCHDLYPSTASAMEVVIPELVRRGYTLVTVSEMAEARELSLKEGVVYTAIRPPK